MKFNGINHLAMATGDMDATIHFWRDLLGIRPPNKVIVAIARELAGFIWAVLHEREISHRRPPYVTGRNVCRIHNKQGVHRTPSLIP